MATDLQHYSDTWHAGLPLVPPAPARSSAPIPPVRTARALGSLSGSDADALWSFEPGLPPGFDLHTLHLLNCGYRMVSTDEVDLLLLQTAPGLFHGNFPVSVVPELFCSRQPVNEQGSTSTLDLGATRIELTQEIRDNRRLVRLHITGSTPAPAAPPAAEHPDLRDLWASLWKQRMLWLTRMKAEERPVLFDLALEVLEARLTPPAGPFEHPFFCDPDTPGLSLQHLPAVLPALARMEPDAAHTLLLTLSRLAPLPSGALPAFIPLHGTPDPVPAWPVLALAVRTALRGDAPLALPDPLLPLLKSHLTAWITLAGPESDPPRWPSPDHAFTPEIVDDDLHLCDLPALLVAEIDAYRDLAKDPDAFRDPHTRLKTRLLDLHWSAPRGVFLDRTADGQPAKRMTLGGLLPLLWNDLPEDRLRGLHRALAQPGGLRSPNGLLQWEPKDGDPAPAPHRTLSQHLFLRPLLLDTPPDLRSLLGLSWARTMDEHVKHERGFPPEWDSTTPGWHPLTAAFCLRFAPLQARKDLELGKYPAWIRFLERQRQSIISLVSTLAIVIPITIGLFFALRPEYSTQQEASIAGHGETAVALRQFEEAESVYTDLLTRTRTPLNHLTYYAQRGKVRARLQKYDEALADLQRAVELDENLLLPTAHWNLAQVQWRLGDLPAARATLEDILDIFSEGYPDLAKRARNALALLDQGIAPFNP